MDANRLIQPDPGPSQQIIRRFSDDMEKRGHGGTLSQGLAVKVSRDRRDEKSAELLQREWDLLLADADHLAQMYRTNPQEMISARANAPTAPFQMRKNTC